MKFKNTTHHIPHTLNTLFMYDARYFYFMDILHYCFWQMTF